MRWLGTGCRGASVMVFSLGFLLLAAPAAWGQQQDHSGHHAEEGHDDHAHHAAQLAAGARQGVEELVSDLTVPNVEVLTAAGERVEFFRDLVAGKTVAINFVFTTCTTICPPMGANFGRLQAELGDGLGRDVHLISVSVDPRVDTPQRLAAWGEKFGARDGWTLVTGERREITRLLKALEVFTADIRDHSPIVLVGHEPSGEWTRAYGLAPPARLAELLRAVTPVEDADRGAR